MLVNHYDTQMQKKKSNNLNSNAIHLTAISYFKKLKALILYSLTE